MNPIKEYRFITAFIRSGNNPYLEFYDPVTRQQSKIKYVTNDTGFDFRVTGFEYNETQSLEDRIKELEKVVMFLSESRYQHQVHHMQVLDELQNILK